MNQKKSSIFQLDEGQVTRILWIGSIALLFLNKSYFIRILVPFLMLVVEKQSALVRNHAGQNLILNILVSLILVVFNHFSSIVGWLVSWIPLVRQIIWIFTDFVKWILIFFTFAYHLIGLAKAFQEKYVALPLISSLGDRLSKNI